MTEILLYGTFGAVAGIFASCLCGGIAAALRNRRNRRVRRKGELSMAEFQKLRRAVKRMNQNVPR